MASNNLPDTMSDEEMQKYVASGEAKPIQAQTLPDTMSDEEMQKYIASGEAKPIVAAPPGTSASQAALEHFGNAASQGYLPQLQAITEPAITKALDIVNGTNVYGDLPGYTQRRDENLGRLSQEKKEHPIASLVGTGTGALASSIPLYSGISKLTGLSKLAELEAPEALGMAGKIAALEGRTAASAGTAGIQGALSNPGDVPGTVDPIQATERAKNSALAALIAAPLHLTGEGLSAATDYAGNQASKLAFRALGPFKRQVNQNRDQIQEIGQAALDNGIIGWVPRSAATLAQRAGDAAESTGKDLGDLTDTLSELENGAISSGIPKAKIAASLRQKLIQPNPTGVPTIDSNNKDFSDLIDYYEHLSGPEIIPFKDLRSSKIAVNNLINWNRLKNADIPLEEQFNRALSSELKQGEEQGADAIEKAYFGDSSHTLQDLKEKYALLSAAQKIAANKADAQQANQILGLKSTIAGGTGATLGGLIGYQVGGTHGAELGASLGAGAGAIGNKLAADYGAQVASKLLNAGGNTIPNAIGPYINQVSNPLIIPMLSQESERQSALERRLKRAK